jgi:hypothetical protein
MPEMVVLAAAAAMVLLAWTASFKEKVEKTAALPVMAARAAWVVLQVALALMVMAAQVVMEATVAWVAMVPLALMVRCLVIQELLAEWAATAVQVDWLDSADWQVALEP